MRKFMQTSLKFLAAAGIVMGFAATANTATVSAAPKRIKIQQNAETYDLNGKLIDNTSNLRSVKYTGFRLIDGQKAYRVGKNAFVFTNNTKVWNKKYLFKVVPNSDHVVAFGNNGKKVILVNGKLYKVLRIKNYKETGKQYYRLNHHLWVKASQVSVIGDKF